MTVAAAAVAVAVAVAVAGSQEREVREGVGQERLGSPDRDDVGHHHQVHHNQHHGHHHSPHLTSGFFLLIKSRLFSWLTRVARRMKAPVPAHQLSCSDSKSPKANKYFPQLAPFCNFRILFERKSIVKVHLSSSSPLLPLSVSI